LFSLFNFKMEYVCSFCNIFVYSEESGETRAGLKKGTKFEEVPDGWICPVCGKPKNYWKMISSEEFKEKKKQYDKLYPLKDNTAEEITDYMYKARAMLPGTCSVNKVCDGHPDRLCMGLKYGRPIGFGGAGQGRTFTNNFKALEKWKLKMKVIKKHKEPEFETEFLRHKIKMPFLVSSMSGVKISMNDSIPEAEFQRGMIEGAKLFGTIGLSGNTVDFPEHPGIEIIKENKGWGIPVFKPQSPEKLLQLFKRAEEADVIAIGVDLDGFGSTNWELRGKPVYRKSEEELKELVQSTKKPVILKGIMTVEDALKAVDSGAAAIDISNHGGRVMDSGLGVADVLPDIAKAVKQRNPKVIIMADGAVRSGFDILKLLALGADFVLAGRPLGRMALAGGAKAVAKHLEFFMNGLRMAMIMTGCDNLKEINPDILIKYE